MKRFWDFIRDDSGGRVMRLEGPIDEDQLWGDEITPKDFRDELDAEDGDLTLWINSPGGNVFAASEIYTMLRDYKGKITVKIDSIAASAASVVAMAGDEVLISPTGMLMIHDPSTVAMGNSKDMEHAIDVLNEVKEAIINAYAEKSGLRRNKIAELMSNETWMNAKKAVELGFADGILFDGKSDGEQKSVGVIEKEPEKPGHGTGPDEDPSGKEDDMTDGHGDVKSCTQVPHLFFAKKMDLAILNRLCGKGPDMGDEGNLAEASAKTGGADGHNDSSGFVVNGSLMEQEDAGNRGNDLSDSHSEISQDPSKLEMTLSGKTTDGSVPYIVLKRQLDLLK